MKSAAATRAAFSRVAERLRRYGWEDGYDPHRPHASWMTFLSVRTRGRTGMIPQASHASWMTFLSVRTRGMKEDLPNRNSGVIPLPRQRAQWIGYSQNKVTSAASWLPHKGDAPYPDALRVSAPSFGHHDQALPAPRRRRRKSPQVLVRASMTADGSGMSGTTSPEARIAAP